MKIAISVGICLTLTVNLLLYPVGALDVYNYILELKIAFFYHQNPYLTTFASFASDPAAQYGFFNNVPLFYGPIWLFLSAIPTLFTGFGDTQAVLLGLKLENVVFVGLTAFAIYKYQHSDRRGWIAAYLFLANPLIVFEAVGNAHNDMMMTCFLVLAVFAVKRRSSLGVPVLAFSALIKFFSAALFPLFVLEMFVNKWSFRRVAASCLLALALVVGITLPVWAGGQMLVGLAQGVSVAQSLSVASLFSVVREYLRTLDTAPEIVSSVQLVFIVLFGLSVLLVTFLVWRGTRFESGLIDTFLLFAVLVSLLTPWYLLPALGLIALGGDTIQVDYLMVATCLGLLYYPLSVWAWFDAGISTFQVHLFQAMLLTVPILVLFAIKLANRGVRVLAM